MTRLYLPPSGGTPGITPAASASWTSAASMARVVPTLTANSVAFATQQIVDATATSGRNICFKQYVYPLPLNTAFTTTQTVRGQVLAFEAAAANNFASQCTIRVIASDGTTVRSTLLAVNNAALSNEWNTALRNAGMPRGTAATPVNLAANYTSVGGDYLVIEQGFIKLAAATGTGNIRYGTNAASDLLTNETSTADLNTWIEFTTDLVGITAVAAATGHIFLPTQGFTGANGTTLSTHNPDFVAVEGVDNIIIANNRIRAPNTDNTVSVYRYRVPPVSNEYDVRSDFYRPSTTNETDQISVWGRLTGETLGGRNGYFADWTDFAGTVQLLKHIGGVGATQLGSVTIAQPAAGTSKPLELRIRTAVKQVTWDGVLFISSTDNTITDIGKAGIANSFGSGSDAAGTHMDNVIARDTAQDQPPSRTPRHNPNYRM